MHPSIGCANLRRKFFEMDVDGLWVEVRSERCGKDESGLTFFLAFPALPFPACFQTIFCLGLPPVFQKFQYEGGWGNDPVLLLVSISWTILYKFPLIKYLIG